MAGTAAAQNAVQLPTFSFFGTSTTVSVPDRGSVYLGGIDRASTGLNEFGTPLLPFRPFKNRSFGMERSAASTRVSVYVHDFQAMDELLLSQPTSRFPHGLQPGGSGFAAGAGRVEAGEPSPAVSVAELRAEHAREEDCRAEEAVAFFERGKKAESEGKANVARIYYQMAARRASDELKPQIAARLHLIDSAPVAQGGP
jgi:hypothetical protein